MSPDPTTPTADGLATAPPGELPSPAPPPAATRFELGERIARGGMGEVFTARDHALGREVAVKVLRPSLAGTGAERRFRDESRITGQLQHPGVPPVYDLGTLPDGRPFLAMKLIKGRTLDALLAADGPGGSRWLGVFEGVCQAVGYAHAHGVVHRDLKPQNVMVGAFGEVQVMDWGVAKVLAEGGREAGPGEDPDATAPGTVIESARDAWDATRAGSVLGTPAYMAPEQAVGAVGQLDRRTDVFGLGAVLCALLTGRPPFADPDPEAARQASARGKLDDAFGRLAASGADPGLVALCRRCLAVEPAGRPADAGAVATEVAALRRAADDRARRAELAAAEGRVRRRLQLRLGGLAAAVLLAGLGGVGWQWRRAVRQERATADALREKTAEELAKADALAAADANLRLANRRLASGNVARGKTVEALRKLTSVFSTTSPDRQVQLTGAERTFVQEVLGLWRAVADTRESTPAAQELRADGLNGVGQMHYQLKQWAEAEAALRAAVEGWEQLVADKPNLPPFRDKLYEVRLALSMTLSMMGRDAEAEAAYRATLTYGDKLLADHPSRAHHRAGLAIGYRSLGVFLWKSKRLAEAEVVYREAVRVLEPLAAEADVPRHRLHLTDLQDVLANILIELGRTDEVRRIRQDMLSTRRQLVVEFPDDLNCRVALAGSLTDHGNFLRRSRRATDSLSWFDEAVAILTPTYAANPGLLRVRGLLEYSHQSRAEARHALGRGKESVSDWEQAVGLSLPDKQPDRRAGRATSLVSAGQVERAVGEVDELSRLPRDWSAGQWYDFACVYSLASGKLPDKQAEYAARAVALLRQAVAAGWRRPAHTAADPDLDPIRDRLDFRWLLAKLRAKYPPPERAPAPRPAP